MENEGRRPLAGSECSAMPGSRVAGPVDPNEQLLVTVHLPPKTALADPTARRISREDFAKERGADPEGIAKVKTFAATYGLHVEKSEPARRTITLSGTASAFARAFGVTLSRHKTADGTYRGYDGTISLPASLEGQVTAVLGLDNRPQARPQIRFAATGAIPFTPPQVATLYGFPAGVNGTGQCVGIIELGGGFTQSDYTAYFSSLGLTAPKVTVVSVLGATNSPGTDTNADAEVMLDVEVSGGVAPGISVALYFAPNTDQGFIEAVSTAIHDTANKPAVVSISWGGPESTWAQQSVTAFNQTLADAATLGVTVCAASGDSGSSDGVSDGKAHVDFPASSPYVLGCGGTRLIGSGAAIASETVWNEGGGATGGGVSDLFALPTWQANAHVPPSANNSSQNGRGVPDVAADADPQTGYNVRVDGADEVIGGTSASAPLWAGLIALLNQRAGKQLGFINASLYAISPDPLRDITSGSNGAYNAGPGWDACTGLGSPNGTKLTQALT